MTATQTPIHVSSNFFGKAARYFGSFRTSVAEIIQNSYRASLPIMESGNRPRLDITFAGVKNNTADEITFRDYGMGIQDVGAALSIAVSGWDESVEDEQDPAGMGLCAALGFCDSVKIRSDFGELIIHSQSFFEREEYRDTLLDQILEIGGFEDGGTAITMIGPKYKTESSFGANIVSVVEAECFYHSAIDVFLHMPMTKADSEEMVTRQAQTFRAQAKPVLDDKGEPVLYRGYEVLDLPDNRHYGSRDSFINVIWHGQKIEVRFTDEFKRVVEIPGVGPVSLKPNIQEIERRVIVIDHGTAPVTPKLPDRRSLIPDEKTVDFIWGYLGPILERDLAEVAELVKLISEQDLSETPISSLKSSGVTRSMRNQFDLRGRRHLRAG